MSEILCVTSRALCAGRFLEQLERIAAAGPAGILLREKDLPLEDYVALAREALEICGRHQVPCLLHAFPEAARRLNHPLLHMPLGVLRAMPEEERRAFRVLGASCHSVEDAREAERLGCTYITAGHVFSTACKAGLAPRGLEFLREVCGAVSIPVAAIGGITPERWESVRAAGAAGACLMSSLMEAEDPERLLDAFN